MRKSDCGLAHFLFLEVKMENRIATKSVKTLIWSAGIPMIISMVLQALYNIIDTAFVINMDPILGEKANLALTYAFPIQIFMIALGVGTGIGINALLSRYLGENNELGIKKTFMNSIFIMLVIFLLFVLIGAFLAKPFIRMQSNGDQDVIEMGRRYLFIVCVFSLGNVGFTVFERFLQATGRTLFSMISQVSGALTNIFLDWLFIYPLHMGIDGAAIATVIGQFVAWGLALMFHFLFDKEIKWDFRYAKPDARCILSIYKIGWSAAIMQALLSVMMLGMNLIFKCSHYEPELLQGTFGIYYKIQQIPLFACFGMSNCLITLTAFNYGNNKIERLKEVVKWGIIDTCIVGIVIAVIFEVFAFPISKLFGLAGGGASEEIVAACTIAIRIASVSYVFMALTIGIQGILQGLGKAVSPLVLSLCRLCIFVFPVAYAFTFLEDVVSLVWITLIISELLTAIISILMIKKKYDELKLKTRSDR